MTSCDSKVHSLDFRISDQNGRKAAWMLTEAATDVGVLIFESKVHMVDTLINYHWGVRS